MKVSPDDTCVEMYKNVYFILHHLDCACVSYTLHGSDTVLWKKAFIDSRHCIADSFFIGLSGEIYNGGDFARDAVNRGARVLLTEYAYASAQLVEELENKKGALICVANAREAFEKLAHSMRMREGKNTVVIGITGSAGKTTTKEILRSLLRATGSEGNLNTVQGLCLSIVNARWSVQTDAETADAKIPKGEEQGVKSYAVFECGISHEDEMQILARILQPDCALITNVGSAHLGHFSSRSRLQDEKLAIASHMTLENTLWIPEDDEVLLQKAKTLPCTVQTHGFKSCKGFVSMLDKGVLGTVLQFENDYTITLRMPSLVNAHNAVAALSIAASFSIAREESAMALEQCPAVAQRYEIVHMRPLIVDDSYNANTNAMIEAISWFMKNASPPYLFVLGGMKELGTFSIEEHRAVLDALVASISHVRNDIQQFANIVLVGSEYDAVHLPDEYEHICIRVRDAGEACMHMKNIFEKYQKCDVDTCSFSVLLKGSRAYALDEVIECIIACSKKKDSAESDDKITIDSSVVH